MEKDPIKITKKYIKKKDVCTRFKRGGIYNMQNFLNIDKNKSNNLRESQ